MTEGLDDDPARARSRDPAPASHRALAHWHHRHATARASQHRAPRARPSRRAGNAEDGASFDRRALPRVHRRDAHEVSDAARESSVPDGARAWLPRRARPLPRDRCAAAPTTCGRSVLAATHVAGRASASGLGAFRQAHRGACRASADGLRDGALLLAAPVPALLFRRLDELLHPRSCGSVRVLQFGTARG